MRDMRIEGINITQNDFAKLFNITQQGFNNKLRRDTFTIQDVVEIADYLDMELIIKDKDGAYEYKIGK